MTPGQEIGALVGAAALLVGAVIAWRKLRPETANITVTTADKVNEMTLRFASQVGQENDALVDEIAQLRRDFDQYRKDTDNELSMLRTELRAERAEKLAVKRENDELHARVAELETEVGGLRAEVARLRNGE